MELYFSEIATRQPESLLRKKTPFAFLVILKNYVTI